jgi:hypothetical protein
MPEGEHSTRVTTIAAQGPVHAQLGPRYEVYGEIASGGMASVQYGRLIGPRGFSRAVAIKRLHAHFAREPEFVNMFIDEARLSARLVHANIIHTLDVIETPGEVALVMEYVHGETLWELLQVVRSAGRPVPTQIGCALIASILHGLHAAHEARGDAGQPLSIVHRDVSPQNVLVGVDGIPRVLDFGIAKARDRLRSTPSGEIKGKLTYIAREQLSGQPVDCRTDVYGASVVLWEALTGTALFDGPSESAIVHRVLFDTVHPPSALRPDVPRALDAIVLRGLQREPSDRYGSALAMALELERAVGLATQSEIAAWLNELAGERLAQRAAALAQMQSIASSHSATAFLTPSGTRRIEAGRTRETVQALPAAARRSRMWLGVSALVALLLAVGYWFARGPNATAQHQEALQAPGAEVHEVTPQPIAADAPSSPPSAAVAADRATTFPTGVVVEPPVDTTLIHPPAKAPLARRPLAAKPSDGHTAPATRAAHPVVEEHVEPPPPAPNPRCAVYYEVDARGIRRPKPECL